MKKLLTEWRKYLKEQEGQLKTVGDLRRAVKGASLAKRKGQGAAAVKDVAVSALLDLLPGAGTAKSIWDVINSAYSLPDDKKTNTALDLLNVDDQISAIVDDSVENAFLNALGSELKNEPDERELETLNVTTLLQKYISKEFEDRTVAGFQED
jgi:hypothetical protein